MTWCFRLRFNLGTTAALQLAEGEWKLRESPNPVVMRPLDEVATIAEARRLSVTGRDYATEEEARAAGSRWRDWLTLAFASINVGADFGDRAPVGGFTEEGLRAFSASGHRVLNDTHGLMTFECEPRPLFVGMGTGWLTVGSPHERLAESLDRVVFAQAAVTARERLAYDLYAASFFETNADARFVMLMMALETLIDPQPRSPEAAAFVDTLIARTRESGLPDSEVASIIGTLQWLHSESIGQAGRRLASRLAGRRYQDESPTTFFTRCYELRSRLIHGAEDRPTRDEVGGRAANLEHFVSHLIAGDFWTDPSRPTD